MLLTGALNLLSLMAMCAGGCRDEELVAPRPLGERPPASVLVTSDSICARVSFKILTATTMNAFFPDPAACTTGLVISRGANAKWAQNPNRRMQLYIRVQNRSGQAIQLPVRLYLPANGTTVTVPAGTPASKVLAVEPDSSEAGGGRAWFIGGTGTLAANDSTVIDTLTFNVLSPVTQAGWQFQASAADAGTPPPVPTETNLPTSPLLTAPLGTDTSVVYYRTYVGIVFDDTTSGATMLSVFAQHSATVIGGLPNIEPRGAYILSIPDPGSGLAALDSVRVAIASHHGVRYVFRLAVNDRLDVRSRFPVDGPGNGRADWLTNSVDVKPWNAIRAPIAWGCETGGYTQGTVRLGVIDFTFDTAQGDLRPQIPQLLEPPLGSMKRSSLLTDPTNVSGQGFTVGQLYRSHGTGVASILTAAGDNGTGISGMLWRSDLRLFAYGKDSSTVIATATYLANTVFPAARNSNVHVLLTSLGLGVGSDTATVFLLKQALQSYLQASNKNIFVIATGNQAKVYPIGLVATGANGDSAVTALDAAAASLYTGFPGQILFVAGSDGAGALYQNTNIWSGATFVAAPAVGIRFLARQSDFPSGTLVRNGTSWAAPFAAGVAGMLLGMDSSLTAAEVTSYLARGDTVSRIDSLTGNPIHPTNLTSGPPGSPTGIYQLDAYGALSLLSKERRGTPICGINVRFEYPTGNPHVILERNPGFVDTIPMPPTFNEIQSGGVAQGGRVFSISRGNGQGESAVDEYALSSGQWSVRKTIDPLAFRHYLEKDTVDVSISTDTATFRGTQWGPSGTSVSIATLGVPRDPAYFTGWFQFAPDGRHALLRGGVPANCTNPYVVQQIWLVTLPSGPSSPVLNSACNAPLFTGFMGQDAAWDPTGTRFVVGERDVSGSNYASNYYTMKVVNDLPVSNGPAVRVNDRVVTDYSFKQHRTDPTGTTATWFEVEAGFVGDSTRGCHGITRTTVTFAVVTDRYIPYSDPDFFSLCQTPVQSQRRRGGQFSLLRR